MKWNSNLYDQSHDFVSKYGEGILSYLQPKAEETILDLGCGTGDLTDKIYRGGSKVIGVDSSVEMIEKARAKYPEIEFEQMDARVLKFNLSFDAIFSNAVLHWIPEKELVIKNMHDLLKPGGRIVLEFGAKGNTRNMLQALKESFLKRGHIQNASINNWYYPSIGEYATELENQGFRVTHAEHFDRFTPLKGDQGMKDWFVMFGGNFFNDISEEQKEDILEEVQSRLAPSHFVNGVWYADYKRIRIVAVKE